MKIIISILLTVAVCTGDITRVAAQDQEVIQQRLTYIQHSLDSFIFVNRFQSIESPCLCIDEKDSSLAYPQRDMINSNYRIQLTKNKFNPNGVKCLSEHVARYIRLHADSVDMGTLMLSGTAEITYAYPASSIIQFLGFAMNQTNKTAHFFDKLIKLHGRFTLYPDNDKYRIRLVLTESPYDSADAYLGYLEIVQDAFRTPAENVFIFNFDLMSLDKGDKNNQIGEKFTSTSHRKEMEYYSVLAYNILKHKESTDILQKANAIWLENFLSNPSCRQCEPVYNAAKFIVSHNKSALPNTSPVPAH
jgi:hypothetical protein